MQEGPARLPEQPPLGEATRQCAADIAALCDPNAEAATFTD